MAWPETVRKKDVRVEFYRGSGAGGQNRNKRDTACRMTHIPTGLSGQAQDERSQEQNKWLAWKRLCEQLVPIMKREVQKQRYGAGTERIRTYHEPDQRVTDVRLPGRQWRYSDIVDGSKFGELIEAVRDAETEREQKSSTCHVKKVEGDEA